jgi:hypothetical protein
MQQHYRLVSAFEHEIIRRNDYILFPQKVPLYRLFEAVSDELAIEFSSSMRENENTVRYLLSIFLRPSYLELFRAPTMKSHGKHIWCEFAIDDRYHIGINSSLIGKIKKVACLTPKHKQQWCRKCGTRMTALNIHKPFCSKHCAMSLKCGYGDFD